ncbi:MAG: NAD+ synthase [Methanobacterium sp.]|nr:NAD+ synthase [Methanobacterium sp.]
MDNNKFPDINPETSVKIITEFIKQKLNESNSSGVLVGLSGGIDSSIAAYISAKSINKDRILGLIMPSETTSPEDVEDALLVANNLGIEKRIIQIDNFIKEFKGLDAPSKSLKDSKLANANLKARIRMVILYYHANSMSRMVLGTGNKSELLVGYFTKYGDGGVDLLPLADLYKTDVNKIARYLNIPKSIINKPPSAGLWQGQTDEEEMGITYQLLDKILYLLVDEKLKPHQTADKLGISPDEVLRVKSMMEAAEHKLVPPPIPKIGRPK